MNKAIAVIGVTFAALSTGACGDRIPTSPSTGAIVTFAVADETFRVWLTSAEQIAAARTAQSGGRARIPNGRVVAGAQINAGWNWHMEGVEFASSRLNCAMDGRPTSSARDHGSVADASVHGRRASFGSRSDDCT